MTKIMKSVLLLVLGIAVSGCAGTPLFNEGSQIPSYNREACVNAFFPELKTDEKRIETFDIEGTKPIEKTPTKYKQILPGGIDALVEAGRNPTKANRVLDCILVDFHSDDPSQIHSSLPSPALLSGEGITESKKIPVIDDSKITAFAKYRQLQLFRAHVTTAILAGYGGYNVSGKLQNGRRVNKFAAYDDAAEDANRILQSIASAVNGIRLAKAAAENPDLKNLGSQIGIAYRARDITRLAVVMEAPSVQRGKAMIERIIAAITGKSILQAREAAKIALEGLKKGVIMTTFGNAWLADARFALRQELAKFVKDPNSTPSDAAWDYWDEKIKTACSLIEPFGSTDVDCVPEK